MRTLRLRLLVPLGIGLTLLLLVVGGALFLSVRGALYSGFQETLRAKARSIAARLELRVVPSHRTRVEALGAEALGGGATSDARRELLDLAPRAFAVHLVSPETLDPAFARPEGGAFYRVRLRDGRTAFRSPSWPDVPPDEWTDTEGTVLGGYPRCQGLTLVMGEVRFADIRWQQAWNTIRGDEAIPALQAQVEVVERTDEVRSVVRMLAIGLIGFIALLVLVGFVLVIVLVRRGLRPLTQLRDEIDRLDPSAHEQRVALDRPPAELVPVVDALNQRLDALQEAFERERRTTAHIAHELRTPIAELRSLSEVALQFPDDAELTRQSLEQGHEAAVHMSALVEAVLRLARARRPEEASDPERLDLAARVEAAWNGLRAAAEARRQTLDADLPDALDACAAPEAVSALLANLLGNAVRHAPPGSAVRVTAGRAPGRVVLELSNPCTDLDADDLDHLAEPFWRKDPARTDSELGGLGLALARAWAEAAGVDLGFALRDGAFVASLRLPTAPDVT